MKCDILFSDMDGTLLDDNKEISAEISEAIHLFTKRGGRLVLSSGRPLVSILETKEKLGLNYPGMYVIAYNGALVYDCQKKKPVYEKKLPIEDVEKVLALAGKRGLHCHTYSDTHIVAERETEELRFYREHIHMPYVIAESAGEYLRALQAEPYKMLAISFQKDRLEEFRQAVLEMMPSKVQALYSTEKYLELMPFCASKGAAVRFLCDLFLIPLDRAAAAGDAANDISMLREAGVSVAMKNATKETKEAATYVSMKTNNEAGILEVFEKWLI